MFTVVGNILAQGYRPYGSSKEKPEWAETMFSKDLKHSYLETVMVRGESQSAVRDKAKEEIAKRRQLQTGEVFFSTNAEESDGVIVSSKLMSEYWEYDGAYFRGYFLFQTRENRKYDFDSFEWTDKYPFSASVFIPGMAQIHKGSTGKGIFFIAGEIALVGGIVVTQSLKASYESKVSTTHNAKDKLDYITQADNMGNISNVLIAGAAALYVWNIIDGIAAKGKNHFQELSNNNLKITPFAAPDFNGGAVGGLALSFNF
ncbi:hypothetical protein AGMMS49982_01440 [Bacteroidia bacterium]|nr:hypothetical protein AGMMS49982_01440 [Bacteroidia bacterium]